MDLAWLITGTGFFGISASLVYLFNRLGSGE